jgi:hypothetical protein
MLGYASQGQADPEQKKVTMKAVNPKAKTIGKCLRARKT